MHWPHEWLDFINFFSFLNVDIVDFLGVSCMTKVNFFVRFMVLASLPGTIVLVSWARIKWSLKPQRLKNMEGEERKHLLRLEAESLFDSINDDDDGTLNPAEMRQAINEILGKTSHQAVVLHRAGSRGGHRRRRTSRGPNTRHSFLPHTVSAHARSKNRRQLDQAGAVIEKLGGVFNENRNYFELEKVRFLDAFTDGTLSYILSSPLSAKPSQRNRDGTLESQGRAERKSLEGNTHDARRFEDRAIASQLWRREKVFCATTLLFLHLPVSVRIFQFFHCRNVAGKYFLRTDYGIECGGGGWLGFLVLIFPIAFSYTIGVPVFIAYKVIYQNWSRLQTGRIRQKYGFLYERFHQ